eukprot:TRINITY_DN223_c0_g1_i6.p1 TRINITY_DN223_c0_g1~~TRINITY_DN223_c0_g1_i6.p1  ORF type:complete len:699 (+),score=160.98 TRINITY_DN223_c0_g1_i6:88-2097(+)
MMQLHGVGEQYDEQTWQEIVACMAEHSIVEPDVLQSSDGGWNGFIQYSESDGQPDGSDPWRRGGWIEWDPTPLGDDNNTIPGATEIQINEPCNFASNAAYCRTAVAMCAHTARGGWNMAPASVTGLVQSYVSLCMGSAFFHASGTSLGGAVDNMPIGHLALIAHQAAMATIPYQPIIHDLADAPRSKDGNGFAKEMTALFINESVYIWEDRINAMDVPNYYNTFASTVAAVINIVFPPPVASAINAFLLPLFLNPDEVEFVLERFEPAIQQAFADQGVDPPLPVAADLMARGGGTIIKMLYAFLWQEQLIPGPWLRDEEANVRGAEVMPDVNALGNSVSGYIHTDPDIQNCISVYPGDGLCRQQQPHSKWHEQSGNALVDLMWLTDDMDRVIAERPLPRRSLKTVFPLEACAATHQCWASADLSDAQWPAWLVDATATCLPVFWAQWPHLDYAGLVACVTPKLAAQVAALPQSVTNGTLEGCLVHHGCLVADAAAGVDAHILAECLVPPHACAKTVDATVAPCAKACGSSAACVVGCAAGHAELLPSVDGVATCLPLLGATEVGKFVRCVGEFGPFPELEAMFGELRAVAKAVGACVQGPCEGVASEVAAGAMELAECTEWCVGAREFHPFPMVTLPRELGCAVECHFNSKSFQAIRARLSAESDIVAQ